MQGQALLHPAVLHMALPNTTYLPTYLTYLPDLPAYESNHMYACMPTQFITLHYVTFSSLHGLALHSTATRFIPFQGIMPYTHTWMHAYTRACMHACFCRCVHQQLCSIACRIKFPSFQHVESRCWQQRRTCSVSIKLFDEAT